MPPTLYLIDGHALAYRTYFALTPTGSTANRWMTTSGEPTAGVFGFASVLLRILEQEKPEYIAVAFDTGKTFRDELFPEYKATREKMPDDLRPQIERIRQLVDAFGIPRLEMNGFEADDVLGSVANKIADQGMGVKIITGDRDLLQLVGERIIVSLPGRQLSDSKDYTPDDVQESLGVRPDQVVDYKALVGDKSDNIPGVVGVGKVTATALLEKYEDLDGIYAHLDELKPGVRKKLETDRDNAYLSRELAKIVNDLDISLDLDQARCDKIETGPIEGLFRELEFRSLMKRLMGLAQVQGAGSLTAAEQMQMFPGKSPPVQGQPSSNIDFEIIDSLESLDDLVKQLNQATTIAFDTETTSTDQMQADLVGISLAVEGNKGFYIPLAHRQNGDSQLPMKTVIQALEGPLTNENIRKVGHNLKYDFVMLARNGLRVEPLSFDTMIAEWLRDPNSRNLGLKNLAWVRLGIQMIDIESLIGSGRNQRTMAEVSIERTAEYAAADAAIVLQLIPQLESDLEKTSGISLFYDLEMPLVPVLADMEMAGIGLDTDFLEGMAKELNERMEEIKEKVFQAVGESFNLNSTQQLSKALFERLRIEPPDRTRKTASGYYSTSASVLESIRDQHPVVEWVLEYREFAKLHSTYVLALPQQVNPESLRVHTSFNQAGSVTGRLASTDPNLQNIPIRTDLGRRVRRAFVASPGKYLLAVDYSQVELRVVAHMAKDEAMLEAFRAEQDIHATTASVIYKVPIGQITSQQRRHAKAINFGLIYGMSPFGLTRTTDLTLAEAEDFVETYFKQFPGVKHYLDKTRILAAEQGYVETLMGRRRYFPRLKSETNRNIRGREEREAINAPIQGSAADIMKIAMLRVPEAIRKAGLKGEMLLQVHDELVLECPQDEVKATAKLVRKIMEGAFDLDVPLKTEARYGLNWNELDLLAD